MKKLGAMMIPALVLSLHASRASAQDEGEDPDSIPVEETGGGDDAAAEGGEGAPVQAPRGETAGNEGTPQVSETHVVGGGDTLWDLCSKYLNSPWYWPKIWSYNPQITNPHWIYPGNELRFYPSDENLPTNVEVSRQISTDDQDDEQVPDTLDANELVQGKPRNMMVEPNSFFSSYVGFVSAQAHDQSGEIVNAEPEQYMLADYDRTYVKLKSAAKKGENYAIYRTIREIEHPVSGEPYGYAIEIIGGLTIVDTSPVVATGQIAQAYRPVERGDFVGKWPENFGQRVNPSPNQAEAQGYIIETLGELFTEVGEYHVVFIDRGRSHGVQQGNTFAVIDRGDGFTRDTQGLPNEDIGQVMVVDVQDNASTAVVTGSLRELGVGDKVEMRKQ